MLDDRTDLERDYDALAARLAEAERDEGTLLAMIRHQREILRECLPYINESMAGSRPGRCADDIRESVKALTADSAPVAPRPAPLCDRCGEPMQSDGPGRWMCLHIGELP